MDTAKIKRRLEKAIRQHIHSGATLNDACKIANRDTNHRFPDYICEIQERINAEIERHVIYDIEIKSIKQMPENLVIAAFNEDLNKWLLELEKGFCDKTANNVFKAIIKLDNDCTGEQIVEEANKL